MQQNLVGPFSRKETAQINETSVVAAVFKGNRNGTMIDVGAHKGSACGPFLAAGWTVHAFEPDPENRRILEDNFGQNSRLHITTDAVSDTAQTDVPFFKSDISTGISGLSAFHDSHVQQGSVSTTTLTKYLEEKNIRGIDFLKIDTEGLDLMVLRGFPWETGKPQIIECEFEDSKTVPLGYNFHDLASYLNDRGYSVLVSEWHPVVQYGMQHDWRRLAEYPCELADANGWGNLVAFQNTLDEERFIDEALKRPHAQKPKPVSVEQPPKVSATSKFVDYPKLLFRFCKTVPGVISLLCVGLAIVAGPMVDLLMDGILPTPRSICVMALEGVVALFLVAYLVERIRHEAAQNSDGSMRSVFSQIGKAEKSAVDASITVQARADSLISELRQEQREQHSKTDDLISEIRQEHQEAQAELSRMAKRVLEMRDVLARTASVSTDEEETTE